MDSFLDVMLLINAEFREAVYLSKATQLVNPRDRTLVSTPYAPLSCVWENTWSIVNAQRVSVE